MSLSVVSTPISSLMSVFSSSSSRFSSIFLPNFSTDESEELILSRVLLSLSLKNWAVLAKIAITISLIDKNTSWVSFADIRENFKCS